MKTIFKPALACMLMLGMTAAPLAFAESEHQMDEHMEHMHHMSAGQMEHMQMANASQSDQAVSSSASMSSGEIKKIDKSAGKLTIKHGPLKNLDMPPMTMIFRVKDPAMLDEIKTGDKISFVAEKVDGHLTVTQLQPGK